MSVHQFEIIYGENEKLIVLGNEDEALNSTHYYWVLKDLCDVLCLGNWRDVADRFDSDATIMVNINYNTDNEPWQVQALAVDTYPLIMYLAERDSAAAHEFIAWLITQALPLFGRIICTERLRGREFVLRDEQRRNRTARNRRKKQKRRDKRKIRKLTELSGQNDVTDTNESVKERITTNV